MPGTPVETVQEFPANSTDPATVLVRHPRNVGADQGADVPDRFLPALVALQAAGRLPFDPVITEFAFDDVNTAAVAASSGEAIEPVLRIA